MSSKLVFVLLAAITAQPATLTTTSAQSSFATGDVVPLNIVLANATDVFAFQFDLSFNPAVLSAQSIAEQGYFLANGVSFSPGVIDNTTGSVRFIADSLSGSSPGLNGSATLVSVMFSAVGGGSTTVTLTGVVKRVVKRAAVRSPKISRVLLNSMRCDHTDIFSSPKNEFVSSRTLDRFENLAG